MTRHRIPGSTRKMGGMPLPWVLAVALTMPCCAQAAAIRAVGALGNSGEAGASLVRVAPLPFDQCASGVALDADWTLWVSGGRAINRIGLDGRLIDRFPLEPEGSLVDSKTFAVLNDVLYFLGRLAGGETTLFALPMKAQVKQQAARPLSLRLPERKRDSVPYCLAAQPLNERLVIAAEPKEFADDRIGVYLLSPASDSPAPPKPDFTLPGSYPQGIAVDAQRGVIYLGGFFGLFVGGDTHENVYALTAVRPDGSPLSHAFPVACPKTPALPTQFRGVISLAGGALWDTAWYGFLARLDLQGRAAPGRVVEWHHELGYPTQVLGIGDERMGGPEPDGGYRSDLLCLTTAMPDAFYLARWDQGQRRLTFVRRLGCLPVISSLGLSQDGWVTVATERTQLWWHWDDAPDAPPRKAELHLAVTPGFFQDDRFFALAAQYRLDDLQKRTPVATMFTPGLGDRNEARRVGEPVPMKQPVGLSVQITPGQPNATVFVTDAASARIWRTGFWLPDLRPQDSKWQPVPVAGDALRSPADIVALADGRLLVADEGRIVLLAPQEEEYRVAAELGHWGQGPQERFGQRLRFAVDGPWMLVSDAERDRVVWLDWTQGQFLAQFGETDKPGDDARHLSSPAFVALQGTRAVVADAGNQRVVKLRLEP